MSISKQAHFFSETKDCVTEIIKKLGNKIVMAIPLAAGKPNHFVNAIYSFAKQNPNLELKIITALTLEKPKGKSLLEKRFFEPFSDRVFGNYPDLLYELDRMANKLPKNIDIIEFYFPAGKYMKNEYAQKNYISSNYTHVARDLMDMGVNLIAQMICISEDNQRISLSCNADVTPDIMAAAGNEEMIFVGEINNNLPFMYGDAELPVDSFDYLIKNPKQEFDVFCPPKMAVSDTDYMIGFYASTLVKDDGELQVGIGALGDALVYSLITRHEKNKLYQEIVQSFKITEKFGARTSMIGELDPFEKGLFGATEMLVDSFMFLVESGILKKKVYDHIILQRLLNEGLLSENKITDDTLYLLLNRGAINTKISQEDFDFLQHFGIFKKELTYRNGSLYFEDGSYVEADLNLDESNEKIITQALGQELKNGAIIHGGFFLGPKKFYDWLNALPEKKRRQIQMKTVRKINQLYGHEEIDRLHRKNARFVNTCLMMTLLGAAVSDGLEDGSVISGVGGQYNFVEMAHALPDGHSILQLRATRNDSGKLRSNIVWNYGHITIPRHLRDIVITEYGIAYIRGKTDEEVIKALVQIADSRFQNELLEQAKAAGKLSKTYQIPVAYQNNYPKTIQNQLAVFKKKGIFPLFPFGTDFTKEEQIIGKVLKILKRKTANSPSKMWTILKALFPRKIPAQTMIYLKRMGLDQPQNFEERLYRNMLVQELKELA